MLKLNTEELFANALVELCKEKPLEKITVQNITDFCGAGRQTFYNHFRDKEDLIEYIYLADRKKGAELLKKEYSIREHMKTMLDICNKKRLFYVYAYEIQGQNSLSEAVFKAAVDYFTKIAAEKGGREVLDEKMKMAIRFNCHGELCTVKDWIKRDIRCSSEELADILVDNIPERLKKYI